MRAWLNLPPPTVLVLVEDVQDTGGNEGSNLHNSSCNEAIGAASFMAIVDMSRA